MTRPDRTYAGRMGDSLLDRVTRLPFVIPGDPTGVPASVLLALAPVEGADDLELVLVERPGHLRQHAGQIGLPGGAVDPTDTDGVAAALREAQEEVGLDPSGVRVLGSLDRAYLAISSSPRMSPKAMVPWLAGSASWRRVGRRMAATSSGLGVSGARPSQTPTTGSTSKSDTTR